jgi:hypothetical protein
MRTFRNILILTAMLATQQAAAEMISGMPGDTDSNKDCETISQACLVAGFVQGDSPDKGIWKDCMKPIILGKTVSNVTIDPAVAKACRLKKIEKDKAEIEEFQKAG